MFVEVFSFNLETHITIYVVYIVQFNVLLTAPRLHLILHSGVREFTASFILVKVGDTVLDEDCCTDQYLEYQRKINIAVRIQIWLQLISFHSIPFISPRMKCLLLSQSDFSKGPWIIIIIIIINVHLETLYIVQLYHSVYKK